jgi:hypothetical protein
MRAHWQLKHRDAFKVINCTMKIMYELAEAHALRFENVIHSYLIVQKIPVEYIGVNNDIFNE